MSSHYPVLLLALPFLAVPLLVGLAPVSMWLNRLLVLVVFTLGWTWGFQAAGFTLTQEAWHYHLGGWASPWGLELVLTPFTLFLAGWVWLVGMAAWFYSLPHWMVRRTEKLKEGLFNAFFILSLGSVLGLLFLRDLLALYLDLELLLASMTGLVIVGQSKNWREGFDLFFYGSLGASLFLLATFFLYNATGTLNLDDLLSQIFISKNSSIVLNAGILFALSLGFFFILFSPLLFSRWTAQTPAFLTGYMVSVVVRVAAYLFFVLLFFTLNLPGLYLPWGFTGLEYAILLLFLAHWIWGFGQKELQPMLVLLGTAQLGSVFLGFLLGTKAALTGALLEMVSQVLSLGGLFYIAGVLKPTVGAFPISRLAGLARQKPWTGLALIVFAASIVGIPPTAGSLGKWYLLQGALERGNWVAVIFLGSVFLLSLIFFIKLVLMLYEHHEGSPADPISPALQTPFLLLALALLVLGVFHQSVIQHFIEPSLPKAFQDIPMPNVPFLGQQVE